MTNETPTGVRLRGRLPAFVCGALLLLLGAGRPAAAEDPIHTELREFFRTGKYALYISGKEQQKACRGNTAQSMSRQDAARETGHAGK